MHLSRFLDPKNDVAFKKIFGSEKNKDILIHFLNDILLFEGNRKIIEVEFLGTILDADIASKKESIVDVLCKDKNGAQYIIEMQVDPTQGFEKRAQYYAAKAYGRQPNRGKEGKYSDLKEVIFIAIADYKLFPNKEDYISRHVILDKKTYEHDLKDFSFTFIELPKFKKDRVEELNDITEKWCYFFKHAKETTLDGYNKIIGEDLIIKRAYEALDQFNWSEDELITYEQELKRIWDNKAVEDYKLERAKAEGIKLGEAKGIKLGEAKGKAEGKAEGIKLGEAKGQAEAKKDFAIKLLKSELSVETIAEYTDLSIQEVLNLKNSVK
ncbi:Rpn family recombination-promoting nuclease/putative transposase [Orientia tsutsugamushi]|uniref:Transposase n=1 Tax=Orientia tsutsugamushi TaxID=784 RepID=A0A2U3R830_ORITS|nr:Rpn family recombination-promoting nuclease/putative transposase [Orientia tsutsugamushi]KJV70489.1 putative permease [Orientia tsutsugamushi str. UT76]QES95596.1 Rpn family recombination-promoting nuclease/putative transposase [Orientia tsutsugamushi]SPR09376.1 transposase [Orientia tsutsugamushi]